jgi:hypothetical protein
MHLKSLSPEKKKAILELEGKLHWEGDPEEMRGNRFENIS